MCWLCSFLNVRIDRSGFIDGLAAKKFLQKFYNDRVKLVKFLKFDFAVFLKKCFQKINVRLNFSTRTMSGL